MKKILKVLLISDGLINLAAGLLGPIYAIFVESIGGDILDASGAWAVFLLVSGILIYLIGKWEDHVKHKEKMIVLSYGILTLAVFGYLFVRNPMDLFIVQAILGFAAALGTPAYSALYSRSLDKGKYASEWGTWDAMVNIVTAIGAFIGGVIAAFLGFPSLFIAMGMVSALGFIISILLLRK